MKIKSYPDQKDKFENKWLLYVVLKVDISKPFYTLIQKIFV
jgi:hypothetical protein